MEREREGGRERGRNGCITNSVFGRCGVEKQREGRTEGKGAGQLRIGGGCGMMVLKREEAHADHKEGERTKLVKS